MKNQDYWDDRARQDMNWAQRHIKSTDLRIKQQYLRIYRGIEAEVERLWATAVVNGNPPTRTELWQNLHYKAIYEKLGEYVQSGSEGAVKAMETALDEIFKQIIGSGMDAFETSEWTVSHSMNRVVNSAWSGKNYSQRVWQNNAAIASSIFEQVTDMIVTGKSVDRATRAVKERFGVAYREAERIVRTESAYVVTQASLEKFKAHGRTHVKWLHAHDCKCDVCKERDGLVYQIGTEPRLPAHPNCVCCLSPVVPDIESDSE